MSAYNPSFDIPSEKRKFVFKDDLAYGQQGEGYFASILDAFASGSYEIKTDRYRNGRMVVETNQNPNNAGWKLSGIIVTTADWWVYVYSMDGGVAVVGVERLKRYLKRNKNIWNETTKSTFAESSDNPSRGFLLQPEHVIDLLANKCYDLQ